MINASNCSWCHGVSDAQSATGSLCGKPEGLSGSKACSDEKNWDDASMKTQQNQACKHALMTHFFFSKARRLIKNACVFVAPPWLQSPLLLVASLGLVKDLVYVFLTNGFDDGRELVGLQLHRQVCGPGTLPLHQAWTVVSFTAMATSSPLGLGGPRFLDALGLGASSNNCSGAAAAGGGLSYSAFLFFTNFCNVAELERLAFSWPRRPVSNWTMGLDVGRSWTYVLLFFLWIMSVGINTLGSSLY